MKMKISNFLTEIDVAWKKKFVFFFVFFLISIFEKLNNKAFFILPTIFICTNSRKNIGLLMFFL